MVERMKARRAKWLMSMGCHDSEASPLVTDRRSALSTKTLAISCQGAPRWIHLYLATSKSHLLRFLEILHRDGSPCGVSKAGIAACHHDRHTLETGKSKTWSQMQHNNPRQPAFLITFHLVDETDRQPLDLHCADILSQSPLPTNICRDTV